LTSKLCEPIEFPNILVEFSNHLQYKMEKKIGGRVEV